MKVEIPQKRAGEFTLPAVGLGTWQMGGKDDRDPKHDDHRDVQAIRLALSLGITHLDTAEAYAAGHAEELVAEAIKKFDRQKLFITSKVAWYHLRYDEVIAAARDSLRRLALKRLDLYLVHGPDPEVPLRETMRALEYLLEQELVRFIGVSNFDSSLLAEAQSHCRYKIVNNQIHYNLESRGHEEIGTLEYCQKHEILVTAYRPLAKANFSPVGQQILQELSRKYQKSPLAIALNWVINKPNVASLIKTANPLHLQEDLAALGWRLSDEDERLLDEEFPRAPTMGMGAQPQGRRR